MNISIIIPAYDNSLRRLQECYNSLYRQLDNKDEIIICNINSTDGLSKSMFPKEKRIKYAKYESETNALNSSIFNSVNRTILVIDPIVLPDKNFLKYVKESYKEGSTLIFDIDGTNKCNMYALVFDRINAIKVGGFNEYFDRPLTSSHGILFSYLIDKFSDIIYSDYPLELQSGDKRKNKDGELLKILKSKVDNGTYKHKDKNGLYRTINDIKLNSLKIIIPSKQNVMIIDEVKKQITEEDELIVFNSGISTLGKYLKEIYEDRESKNDYILLLNPYMLFFNPDYILDAKLNCNKESISLFIDDFSEYYNSDIDIVDYIRFSNENLSMLSYRKNVKFNKISDNEMLNMNVNNFIKKIVLNNNNVNHISRKETILTEKYRESKRKERERKKTNKIRTTKKNHNRDIELKKLRTIDIPRLYQTIDEAPKIELIGNRPKILLMSDVKGWAWWNKSLVLKQYLSDEFDIDIISVSRGEFKPEHTRQYDLYVTYGYSYIHYLRSIPFYKRVSGITAHRPLKLIKNGMRKVAFTHANSMMLYEELQKVHPIVFYVPNGVDEEKFHIVNEVPKERENLIVGHVGKLCKEKGQKDIIEPAVRKAGVEYISNYSDFRSKKEHSSMIEFYNDIDVFICASIEDGTPNPCLESAACGRPIISNKIGNMPEFIVNGENGFLVERNVNAYVEKLKYLKENREHLIEMGKNARKTVEEDWTWKKQAENYRRMFKSIFKMEIDNAKIGNIR